MQMAMNFYVYLVFFSTVGVLSIRKSGWKLKRHYNGDKLSGEKK